MSFEWQGDPPDVVFPYGMEDYELETFSTLAELCREYAERIQDYIRANAPWENDCMPGNEYLKAEQFYPDAQSVGIKIWYDLDLYRSKCGEEPFDWGWKHEALTFEKSGVIAIIVPRNQTSPGGRKEALGQLADELWDAVRALYK